MERPKESHSMFIKKVQIAGGHSANTSCEESAYNALGESVP